MSTKRRMIGAHDRRCPEVKTGPNGRKLCRWCSTEVPRGRRTFCSERCVDEWMVRTSPSHARLLLERRDHGICAYCGIDTNALRETIRDMARELRYSRTYRDFCVQNNLDPDGWYSYWAGHHVVPVHAGGGECGLDNFVTLCIRCHRAAHAKGNAAAGAGRVSG